MRNSDTEKAINGNNFSKQFAGRTLTRDCPHWQLSHNIFLFLDMDILHQSATPPPPSSSPTVDLPPLRRVRHFSITLLVDSRTSTVYRQMDGWPMQTFLHHFALATYGATVCTATSMNQETMTEGNVHGTEESQIEGNGSGENLQ